MKPFINTLTAIALGAAVATTCFAESVFADGNHNHTASPFFQVENEPAPKLTLNAPLAEPLSRGVALIEYRLENFRVVSVFGADATKVSPRVGHLHVTVDDLPWHWADTNTNNTIVVAGLPAGQHKILIELADPDHQVYTGQTVTFTVPKPAS